MDFARHMVLLRRDRPTAGTEVLSSVTSSPINQRCFFILGAVSMSKVRA